MTTKYLNVQYRHAKHGGETTFEDYLRACIDAEHSPGKKFSQSPAERVMVHAQDGREFVLNEFADVVEGVAGIICEIVPGLFQPILQRKITERQLTNVTVARAFSDQSAS